MLLLSTPPIVAGAWVTERPPIKMPSGPCWPPDERMPRMHHVGAVKSHLPLPPVCHFTLPSACVLLTLHHRSRHNKAFSGTFSALCWQTNLTKDESRPLACSLWKTAADGGVGMWINRLAARLTDGIYRRSRRTRELISLGEHASARFIRLGGKFGSFPRSGGSINQRLRRAGEQTALLRNMPQSCVRHILMLTNFGNTKWEMERGEVRWLGLGCECRLGGGGWAFKRNRRTKGHVRQH